MQKYLFILGKNWRLALAELDTYLQLPQYLGRITDYSANVAVIEFENSDISLDLLTQLIIRLGTVQKIGRMLDFIDRKTLEAAFPQDIEHNRAGIYDSRESIEHALQDVVYEVYKDPEGKKCFVANSIYPIEFSDPYYKVLIQYFLQFTNKYFNTFLKEKGAKQALYYQYPQKNIDSGNLNPIFPHHFQRYRLYEPYRAEILYCQTEEGMYLGHTIVVIDSNFQKKLDEERPFKDYRQTIPPKFAKALLSFLAIPPPVSQVKILDPFCGTGTLLMFASLMGFNVYGADMREDRVTGTRKNLIFANELFERKISEKELEKSIIQTEVNHLSEHFKPESFSGIVSEPVLLPFYEKRPDYDETQKEVDEKVVPIYKQLLEQAMICLKPGRRLAIISPIINTSDNKHIKLPIRKMAEKMGFRWIDVINPKRIMEKSSHTLQFKDFLDKPLFDAESERISREFLVFEKPKIKSSS